MSASVSGIATARTGYYGHISIRPPTLANGDSGTAPFYLSRGVDTIIPDKSGKPGKLERSFERAAGIALRQSTKTNRESCPTYKMGGGGTKPLIGRGRQN